MSADRNSLFDVEVCFFNTLYKYQKIDRKFFFDVRRLFIRISEFGFYITVKRQ